MKRLFLLSTILLTACGDDSSNGVDGEQKNQQALQWNELLDSELDRHKSLCVDSAIARMDIKLEQCLVDAEWHLLNDPVGLPPWYCPESRCRSEHASRIIEINQAWEEIKARALQAYENCVAVRFNLEFFGPDFCRNEYFKVTQQSQYSCHAQYAVCVGW